MLGVVGKVYTLPSSAPVILLLSLSCGVSHFCCHKLPLLLLTVSLVKTFPRTGSVGKLKKEDIMSERSPPHTFRYPTPAQPCKYQCTFVPLQHWRIQLAPTVIIDISNGATDYGAVQYGTIGLESAV